MLIIGLLKGAVLSMPRLWQSAFSMRHTLRPGQSIASSVLDIYLMSIWYDIDICQSTKAIYVDSHTASAWIHNPNMDTLTTSYRTSHFLPATGPCQENMLLFIVDRQDCCIMVFMDISTNSVHVAAPEPGPGTWDDWDGPSYYLHMCSLNGWSCPNVSAVKVSCIFSKVNYPTYCSTMSCSLAVSIMEAGWELNGHGGLQIPSSMGCQHLIRKKIFEDLVVNLLN